MLKQARQRAKRFGVPFRLSVDDFEIPLRCPILGVKLKPCRKRPGPNSPSLDRIVPTRGYVPGNVAVMSYRANRIKFDATLRELRLVLKFIEKHHEDRLHQLRSRDPSYGIV